MLVTDRIIEEIGRLGILRRPNEACGLLFPDKVVELENMTIHDPTKTYALGDAASILRTILDAGVDRPFVGEYIVWHTHPGGLIGPSPDDMEHRVEGVEYLVVALTEAGPVPARF